MSSVCFYFQVHQPYRLRHYTFFDIGSNPFYEDEDTNCDILLKVARKCYLPMNDLLFQLIKQHQGAFKVAFSLSGTALDQFEEYAPEVLESFQALARTGAVEFLAETYTHSLAFMFSKDEFRRQVEQHARRIEELFGQRPTVFRNTELIYNNEVAAEVEAMGFKAVLAEGADHVLGWRSPNFVYRPSTGGDIKILLKNYALSDDIAFRFSNDTWPEYPLTAEKYAAWIHTIQNKGEVINLFMDYETFGEHHWESSGIFDFMRALPSAILANPAFEFKTPSEVAATYQPKSTLDVMQFMSWADSERDLTAWLGNDMQHDAVSAIYKYEPQVRALDDPRMTRVWERLQTSDHFYYMSTKWFSDGDVHKHFNPYGSPYDAYINYMNVQADFQMRLDAAVDGQGIPVSTKEVPLAPNEVRRGELFKPMPPLRATLVATEPEEQPAKKSTAKSPAKAPKTAASSKSAPAKPKSTAAKTKGNTAKTETGEKSKPARKPKAPKKAD